MIVEAGAASVICHCVLLMIFGFNNRKILLAMGEDDSTSNANKPPLSSRSVTAFIGVVAFRFMPTVIVACTASSWIGAAYNSEAAAYTFLVLPIGYAVLLLLWWISQCGRCCDDAFQSRINNNNIDVDRARQIRGGSLPHSRNDDGHVTGLSSEARMIRKNMEKEHAKRARTYAGTSLRGSNADYYAVTPGSAVEMMAMREASAVPSEQSPYLEKRKAEHGRNQDRALFKAEAIDRQHRINEAFEEYVEAVRMGQDGGLFIVDGEVIPVDDAQRQEIATVIAQRGSLY